MFQFFRKPNHLMTILTIACIAGACRSQDWKAKFEDEAPNAWRSIHRKLFRTSFCRTRKGSSETYQIKCGQSSCLAYYIGDKGNETIAAINPKYQFMINRLAGQERWELTELVVGPPDPVFYDPEKYESGIPSAWLPRPMVSFAANLLSLSFYGVSAP